MTGATATDQGIADAQVDLAGARAEVKLWLL
jgi:hypothetical protein